MANPVITKLDADGPSQNNGIDPKSSRHSTSLHSAITFESPQAQGDSDAFRQLRRLVRSQGLLDRQRGYYGFKIASALLLMAASVTILVTVDSLAIQLLNAVFMGFAFSQAAFLGHDAGHFQIAKSARNNHLVGLLITFLIAMDLSWWMDKHNRHHANPNQLEMDDDIEVSVLAFTEEQALSKPWVLRLLIRHQAFLFFPILCLSSISLRFGGIHYLLTGGKAHYQVLEPSLIFVHGILYLGGLYMALGLWEGAAFLVIHHAVAGLLMGGTFAPNHKGMPVLDKDSDLDFLQRQVITSRNVRSHPITDLCYGGLNYQIEHHLFPSMPRNNLKKASVLIKAFCQQQSLPYHETSVAGSNWEMLKYLHRVSRPLRMKAA